MAGATNGTLRQSTSRLDGAPGACAPSASRGAERRTPEEFRNSSLGNRVLQDVALAKSFAVDQTGDLARGRYNRLIDELNELMNQIDTVDVEIAAYLEDRLSAEQQQQQAEVARNAALDVEVDEEHQMWPFDGEYWRDELGFYRQQVTSQCGR